MMKVASMVASSGFLAVERRACEAVTRSALLETGAKRSILRPQADQARREDEARGEAAGRILVASGVGV